MLHILYTYQCVLGKEKTLYVVVLGEVGTTCSGPNESGHYM